MANLLDLSRKNPFSNPLHKNVPDGTRKLSCASATGKESYCNIETV